jgi:hypothetical protein
LFKLISEGYGTYNDLTELPIQTILNMNYFIDFKNDYDAAVMELNKNEDR